MYILFLLLFILKILNWLECDQNNPESLETRFQLNYNEYFLDNHEIVQNIVRIFVKYWYQIIVKSDPNPTKFGLDIIVV